MKYHPRGECEGAAAAFSTEAALLILFTKYLALNRLSSFSLSHTHIEKISYIFNNEKERIKIFDASFFLFV